MFQEQPDAPEQKAPATQVSDGSAKRLANLKPFQRGVSGNPGGKPKGEDVRALARKNTKRAFERILSLIDSDDERVAMMAAKEVLDRAYGKPKVAEDDDGAGAKNVTINIVRYTEPNAGNHAPQQLDAQVISIRPLALS